MTLTLTLKNVDRLDNGESPRLVLDRHGAVIGRSPHADWSLPDTKSHLSSTHCEVDYRDGGYILVDKSTNGTFVNGATERMAAPHRLAHGDEISAGPYRIGVAIAGAASAAAAAAAAAPASQGWSGWGDPAAAAAPPASDAWGSVPAPPAPTWSAAPAPEPQAGGGWAATGAAAAAPKATPWGEPAPPPAPPSQAAGWAAPTAAPPSADVNPWSTAPAASPAANAWGAPTPAPAPNADPWGASEPAGDWNAPPPEVAPTGANPWDAPSPQGARTGAGGWGSPTGPAARPASSVADAWGSLPTPGAAPAAPTPQRDPSQAAITGAGAMSHSWSAPSTTAPAPPPPPAVSAPAPLPSPFPSPPPAPEAPGGDVWGQLSSSADVDWSRAAPPAPPTPAPPAPSPPAPPRGPAAAAPGPGPAPGFGPGPGPAAAGAWSAFLAGSGVNNADLKSPEQAAHAAGATLKRLITGLVVMLEARMRAKAQLGATSTALEFDGNNPLKFVRDPEKVLTLLMNPPERGFMSAERAVDDAFVDLQAHQMATLAAMQGALRSTLERFSPTAIRSRAETRGLLAKIMPGAKNAALWDAYEREFEGVAHGSDEAFMDVFAKAFKTAYEESAARMKRR